MRKHESEYHRELGSCALRAAASASRYRKRVGILAFLVCGVVAATGCSDEETRRHSDTAEFGADTASMEARDAAIDGALPEGVKAQYARGMRALADKDKVTYLRSMIAAAKRGHVGATFELGRIAPDSAKAIPYFESAASRGHTRAMFSLGVCYEKRSLKISRSWYMKAAEAGSTRAKTNLGHMYATKLRNPTKAKRWYERAAREGDVDAMLGTAAACYELGELETARAWAVKAAKNGHSRADALLKVINERR